MEDFILHSGLIRVTGRSTHAYEWEMVRIHSNLSRSLLSHKPHITRAAPPANPALTSRVSPASHRASLLPRPPCSPAPSTSGASPAIKPASAPPPPPAPSAPPSPAQAAPPANPSHKRTPLDSSPPPISPSLSPPSPSPMRTAPANSPLALPSPSKSSTTSHAISTPQKPLGAKSHRRSARARSQSSRVIYRC